MDIRDRKGLKNTAGAALAQAVYEPRRLILLHTAVSLGVSLLATLLNYLLTRSIDTTGGLSGMELRTVLSTAQSALQLASSLLLPFWQIGLVYAVIRLARQEQARPDALLEGFRRFGPALRLMLLKGVIFMALAMVCSYVSAAIFLMTPLAEPVTAVMTQMLESADALTQELVLEDAALEQLAQQMMPVMYIFAAVFLVAAAPLFYRLRLADFALMDEKNTGAFAAIGKSWRMTKGSCLQLLKLDVSFWWFYLADGALLLLCYLDLLLPAVGITLPVDADAAFWVCYVVYTLGRLLLYWQVNAKVQTTYALAYEALRQQPEAPKEQKVPKNLPWDEP